MSTLYIIDRWTVTRPIERAQLEILQAQLNIGFFLLNSDYWFHCAMSCATIYSVAYGNTLNYLDNLFRHENQASANKSITYQARLRCYSTIFTNVVNKLWPAYSHWSSRVAVTAKAALLRLPQKVAGRQVVVTFDGLVTLYLLLN